jgi:hypothetical protein
MGTPGLRMMQADEQYPRSTGVIAKVSMSLHYWQELFIAAAFC